MSARLIAAGFLIFAAVPAAAGPPYATDDPEPTDTGHWEIYAFTAGTQADGRVDGASGFDLNYGAVPGVQLTATLPLDFATGARAAAGDIELGVKYRFLNREAAGTSLAIFPRVILPTGGRGFGTGRVRLLLPVWGQKDFGPWSLFGGGGYTLNPGRDQRNFWQAGLALTREVTPRLTLGVEVTHEGPDQVGAPRVTALGAGGTWRLGGPFALLFSGGPAFPSAGRTGLNFYTALALNF